MISEKEWIYELKNDEMKTTTTHYLKNLISIFFLFLVVTSIKNCKLKRS